MITTYAPPQAAIPVLYEDDYLLLVNKPSGLLSVPGKTAEKADCLISRLQITYPDALIVHRLDMSTSGIMVLARGKAMHRALSILFQDRKVDKEYCALVAGKLEQVKGEVDLPLITDWPNRPKQKVDFEIGKPSQTEYECLAYDEKRDASVVKLIPRTGRSHQLRVHMLSIGHAILGDELYASQKIRAKADRLLLHAQRLAFTHPITKEYLVYECAADFL